ILENKRLVLGNTEAWEDKNDALIMEKFQHLKKAGHVLAICFNGGDETIHHWRFFDRDRSCCRITFNGSLYTKLSRRKDLITGEMQYLNLNELRGIKTIAIDALPFFKRKQYAVEEEYRAVYAGPEPEKTVAVSPKDIDHITITDKMPDPLFNHYKGFIKENYGIKVYRTTVTQNRDWIKQFDKKAYTP
ncbi:MAG: hypothetical protein LBK77_04925, partial [Spirochaetaceae bacterium]|nr:hypothetical protein [Spirochaetaceae bacterium]